MLFYNTVSTQLLELIKELQKLPVFKNLRLVGGTSLALQLGHHKSIDIDLFGVISDDYFEIAQALNSLGEIKTLNKTQNVQIYLVNGVKVDIVNYKYKWLKNTVNIDYLKLASIEDIAAMKLNAISGRGTKKDFIDLYFLLKHYSIGEMIQFYNDKYFDGSYFLVLKSLLYFDDAEDNEMPIMLKSIDWNEVKSTITDVTNKFLNS